MRGEIIQGLDGGESAGGFSQHGLARAPCQGYIAGNAAAGARSPMALWIGVDSGGTFTDVYLFEESTGQIAVEGFLDPCRSLTCGCGRGRGCLCPDRRAGERRFLFRPRDDSGDQCADTASLRADRFDHQPTRFRASLAAGTC
jgi:hypothetical protein